MLLLVNGGETNPVLVMLAMLVLLLGENTFVYAGEIKPVLAVSALLVCLVGEITFVGIAGVSGGREHFRLRRRSFGCGAETQASSLKGKARRSSDVPFSSLFERCMSPSQRVAHVSDSVARLLTTQTRDMHASMISCGSMHGAVMHDTSSVVHVNSCGALGHRNSCNLHAAGVLGLGFGVLL